MVLKEKQKQNDSGIIRGRTMLHTPSIQKYGSNLYFMKAMRFHRSYSFTLTQSLTYHTFKTSLEYCIFFI